MGLISLFTIWGSNTWYDITQIQSTFTHSRKLINIILFLFKYMWMEVLQSVFSVSVCLLRIKRERASHMAITGMLGRKRLVSLKKMDSSEIFSINF